MPDDPRVEHTEKPPLEQRYEVKKELGRGGMGQVLLAADPDLGRTVAVKVLLDEGVRDDETRTRFLREAQLTAQLEHPNILPVYALEHSARGAPAFAMKVVRGRTFDDLIGEVRRHLEEGRTLQDDLTLEGRLDLFLRVCDAIAYAHDRGVVHRDLKPENLMLGAFGEVYVVDWGIAKVVGQTEHAPRNLAELPEGLTTATMMGYAVGTPAYMSPEQAAGEIEDVGPASDQYTLGLILQELVSLQRANDTGEIESTLARAIKAERAPLVLPRGKAPRDLEAIIAKATSMEIDDRYPSVAAFAQDLRRFLHHEETVARPDSLLRKPVRWTLRHPALATSLGLAVVLLALLGVGTVAVAGLGGVAWSQYTSHLREQAMTEVVTAVATHAHDLDTAFLSYQGLLGSLATATEQLLQHGRADRVPFYTLQDLREGRGPPDYAFSELYDQGLTLKAPAVVIAPGISREDVARDMYRLAPLVEELHGAVVRSHGPDALSLDEAARRRVILEEGVPLVWSYVGLENGVLLNYPGNTKYSPDYDARERPWYKEARGTQGPAWGEPYPDDSGMGLLLPCNQALYAEDGTFLGVASVSVALRTFVQSLLTDQITGLKTAYVVDEDGMLVVASDQDDLDVWAGLNDGRALDKQPFPEPDVREALRSEPAGAQAVGDDVYVWSTMDAVGWTYVARIDEARALAGR